MNNSRLSTIFSQNNSSIFLARQDVDQKEISSTNQKLKHFPVNLSKFCTVLFSFRQRNTSLGKHLIKNPFHSRKKRKQVKVFPLLG